MIKERDTRPNKSLYSIFNLTSNAPWAKRQ